VPLKSANHVGLGFEGSIRLGYKVRELRIPRDADQRSELMPITIPK